MPDLSDLFKLVAEEKKKKKEEMESLIGDSFDKLFVEQLKPNKNAVDTLEEKLISLKDISYSSIDKLMKSICSEFNISTKKLHKDFVKKNKMIPDEWIKEKRGIKNVEKQVEDKEVKENVITEGLLNILPKEKNSDPLTPLDQNFATLDDLQNHYKLFLNRIQQQLSTIGGGGEVRLEFLDDVDRATAKTNDYYLKYDATLKKWVGDTIPSVGIVSITGITTSYQATNDDDYIGVSADVPVTIVLPVIPSYGKKITVKDEGNKVSTYNITVQAGIGKSVENDSSVVMDINHQSFTYFYNGNNWYLI